MKHADEMTGLEYEVERAGIRQRIIAWKEELKGYKFVIPTRNAYIGPTQEYNVYVKGKVENSEDVLIRVQSECLLGSFEWEPCDCGSQMIRAFGQIREREKGILIESVGEHGKGVGIRNHLRTLSVEKLKQVGEDEARAYLGLRDARDYKPMVVIVDHFKIKSVRLLTNNPKKLEIFQQYGIPAEMVPI